MNQRQFDAAHDRYMDPFEDANYFDEIDECYLASIERQRKLDEEEWLAEMLRQEQEN